MQIGASQVWLSLCKGLSKSERESVVVRVPLAGWLVKVNSLQVLFNSSSPLDQYCNTQTQNTMDTLWLEIQSTSMRSLLRGWKVIQPREQNIQLQYGGLRLTPDPGCYFSNFQETWSSSSSLVSVWADFSSPTLKLMIGLFWRNKY